MKKLTAIILVLIISACSHNKVDKTTAEYMYNNAMKELNKKNYIYAAEDFEKIEDEHPFSEYVTKSQILAVYAYYKGESYLDSIRVAEYFIETNPASEYIDYVYYIKALNYYDRVKSIKKANLISRNAEKNLKEVIMRFPNTEYATDSKIKLREIYNHIAANEMYVGRFHLKNKNYIGAIDKFNLVIDNSNYEKFHPEAYHRLVEVYSIIGIRSEARKAYQILTDKYPETRWYKHATKIMKE